MMHLVKKLMERPKTFTYEELKYFLVAAEQATRIIKQVTN